MRYADTFAYDGPSVLIPRKGSLGNLFYVEGPFWTVDTIFYTEIDELQVMPKFLYYFLSTVGLGEMNQAGGVPSQTQSVLNALKIPVPPLAIQREIASILDKMESLKAELEAELEMRSRQYAFYRDRLLTFPEAGGVRWFPMGEVAEFKYGYTASAVSEGDYRFIRITDITRGGKLSPAHARFVRRSPEADEYRVRKGDLLLARTGATYGKTMLVEEDMAAVYASFLIRIRLDESMLTPAYYWHFAQSRHYWDQADALVSTGGQPQFNANVLKTVRVAIPSFAEQERIVAILDKFDALVNDLSVGLPAEIDARRKQYEYYRDRLLTFEEAS